MIKQLNRVSFGKQRKIVEWYFYALMFSPVISFITVQLIGNIFYQYWRIAGNFLFVYFLFESRGKFRVPRYLWLIFIYAIYITVRHLYSGVLNEKGIVFYFLYYNYSYTIFFLLVIIENTKFKESFIKASLKLIELTIILSFVFIVIQILFDPKFFSAPTLSWGSFTEGELYKDRRFSIFSYVSGLSNGLTLLPLTSVYIALNKNKGLKQIVALVLVGIVCFGSNSRWIIGGYFFLIIQFLIGGVNFYSRRKLVNRITIATVIILLTFYSLSLIFSYNFSTYTEERLFEEGTIENTTRYKAIYTFLKFFPENPIWGTGVHLTEEIRKESLEVGSSQIHVGYLSHLVSYGIVGSLLLFLFWYRILKVNYRRSKYSNFEAGFYSMLIFLWSNLTLVTYSLFEYGILFALIYSKFFFYEEISRIQKIPLNEN